MAVEERARNVHGAPVAGDGVPDHEPVKNPVEEKDEAMAASEHGVAVIVAAGEPPGEARGGDAVRRVQLGMKVGSTLLNPALKKPRRGCFRWRDWKRRRKPGSETMRRQRLQTTEARGREDGSGGRRRRISERRTSSSSGCAGAGEVTYQTEPMVFWDIVWTFSAGSFSVSGPIKPRLQCST
uniref:Uncharacterized protein n=1 Tax=Oryza barthii TaxID=65489 RepID=A0A0D3HB15_9ORYZ